MRAARKDNNDGPITKRLEAMGCVAWDCSRCGYGFGDKLFWDPVSGMTWIAEIKSKGGKLTKREREFHEKFKDCPNVVIWYSEDEAQRAVERARGVEHEEKIER